MVKLDREFPHDDVTLHWYSPVISADILDATSVPLDIVLKLKDVKTFFEFLVQNALFGRKINIKMEIIIKTIILCKV